MHQRRSAAEARLNRLLDRPAEASLPDPPTRSVEKTAGELDRWLEKAERSNPAIRAVRERIKRHRQEVDLARLDRRPDLTVGAHYSAVDDEGLAGSANGEDQWWLSFGFNLPIWDRKQDAAENEARRGVLEGLAELRAERNRVRFEVREAFDRMRAHREHVTLLSESIVPESRQAAEAALSRYRTGADNALTVIDNWQRMLEFERMRYRHRAMYEQAVADLREAVGRELRDEPSKAEPGPASEPNGPVEAERNGEPDATEGETGDPSEGDLFPDGSSAPSPSSDEPDTPHDTASEPPAEAPTGDEATEDQP